MAGKGLTFEKEKSWLCYATLHEVEINLGGSVTVSEIAATVAAT